MCRENIVYLGFSTIHGFRQPLRELECTPRDNGGLVTLSHTWELKSLGRTLTRWLVAELSCLVSHAEPVKCRKDNVKRRIYSVPEDAWEAPNELTNGGRRPLEGFISSTHPQASLEAQQSKWIREAHRCCSGIPRAQASQLAKVLRCPGWWRAGGFLLRAQGSGRQRLGWNTHSWNKQNNHSQNLGAGSDLEKSFNSSPPATPDEDNLPTPFYYNYYYFKENIPQAPHQQAFPEL